MVGLVEISADLREAVMHYRRVRDDALYKWPRLLYLTLLCRCKMSVRLSVCLSDSLSVTRRYSVKTVTHVLKLFSPLGSLTILVFPHQTAWQYSDTWTSLMGRQMQGDMNKIVIFDYYLTLSWKMI